jgi:S1-C subfamily serine protease
MLWRVNSRNLGRASAFVAALLAIGCATPRAVAGDSPVPGCIGAAARAESGHVVISVVGPGAQTAGLRQGDVVLSYNGAAIADLRQFERLVLDTPPGSLATLQVVREGRPLVVDVRVTQVPTEDRA